MGIMIVFSSTTYAVVWTTQQSNQQDIVQWMNEQSLTRYDTVSDFRWWDAFTRQQATRFFGELATNVYSKTPDTTKDCSFGDIAKADPSLVQFIIKSCQLGLFNGSKWNFMPEKRLTNAQAVTVMVRLLEWKKLDETWDLWYSNYYNVAKEKWFLAGLWLDNVAYADADSSRWEVGSMMYQADQMNVAQTNTTNTNVSVNGNNNTTSTTTNNTNMENSNNTTNNTTTTNNTDNSDSNNTTNSNNSDSTTVNNTTVNNTTIVNEESNSTTSDTTNNSNTTSDTNNNTDNNGSSDTNDSNNWNGSSDWSSNQTDYSTSLSVNESKLYNILYNEKCVYDGWYSSLYYNSCKGDLNEKFYITSYWDWTFRFFNEKKETCIVAKNWAKEEGYVIYTTCNDSYDSQKRHIEHETVGSRIARIRLKWSNLCVNYKGSSSAFSRWVFYLKPCDADETEQYFVFNEVAGVHYVEEWNGNTTTPTTPSCSSSQHEESWSCVSNSKTCSITNGNGTQTRNGSSRWSCQVSSCNNGYNQNGNVCEEEVVECTPTDKEIKDNGVCYDRMREYTVANGKWLEVYKEWEWYSRKKQFCNYWFNLVWESCVAIETPTCTSEETLIWVVCTAKSLNLADCNWPNWLVMKLTDWSQDSILNCANTLPLPYGYVCGSAHVWQCRAVECNPWYRISTDWSTCEKKVDNNCERFQIWQQNKCMDPQWWSAF